MLQSTPMLSRQDSADPRACQPDNPACVWTHAGTVDTRSLIAAVVRAYNDVHPLTNVTPDAIFSPSRATHVAQARHLCAYLLVEDYHLTNMTAARALGRTDHTTVVNSRARVTAALDDDRALRQALAGARDILSGGVTHARPRRAQGIRQPFAGATPRELAEYRYWRLRSLHPSSSGGAR